MLMPSAWSTFGTQAWTSLETNVLPAPIRLELCALDLDRAAARLRLGDLDDDVPDAAELLDRLLGVVERLAVPPRLVLDRLDALALDRAGDDGHRPVGRDRLPVCLVDLVDVVAVDLDRVPAEGASAVCVGIEVPAVHGLAALPKPVDVQDRDDIVELVVGGVLERLPLRAFGHLAVADQHPSPHRCPVEPLAGDRHADAVGQALSERAGRDIDPRDPGRRVALEDAGELAVGQQLLVGDHPGRLVHRVEQRRSVPLGEDEPVVGRILRLLEVVAEVLGEQHGHQVSCGHARSGVTRLRFRCTADGIDAELLSQLTPEFRTVCSPCQTEVRHGHLPPCG